MPHSVTARKAPVFVNTRTLFYARVVRLRCFCALCFRNDSHSRCTGNAEFFLMLNHHKTAYRKRNLTALCIVFEFAGRIFAITNKCILSAFVRVGIYLIAIAL